MRCSEHSRTREAKTLRYLDGIRSYSVVLAMTLVLASVVSCSPSKPLSSASPDPDEITLYEGLPHQGYEAKRFAEESKKPTIEKGGFPFYREPLTLKEADAKALGAVLARPDTFQPFGGEKKCGGFHPDYAIVVSASGEETTYLICFGCGEAKVYGPDRSETRYDFGHDSKDPRLSAILKPYQKNRPMPIEGP